MDWRNAAVWLTVLAVSLLWVAGILAGIVEVVDWITR